MLHLNIQGLWSKLDDFREFIAKLHDCGLAFDVIFLCETFINDHNVHYCTLPGYRIEYKNRQTLSKGGLLMYIRDSVESVIRDDLSDDKEGEFETLFVKIRKGKAFAIAGEIYRVPNSNTAKSLERFELTVNKLKNEKCELLIGTDQNFDYLKIDSDHATSNLLDTFLAATLVPTITKPTRVTANWATLIDNIYLSKNTDKMFSRIFTYDISDHFPIFCLCGDKQPHNKTKQPMEFKYRPMSEQSLFNIKNALDNKDWSFLQELDTNTAYTECGNYLRNITDIFAPEKTAKIPSKYTIREQWMKKGLMKSSYSIQKRYRNCKDKDRYSIEYLEYIRYRNLYNKLKRIAKNSYFTQLFETRKENSKQTWKIIKNILKTNNDKRTIVECFKIDNTLLKNDHDISNGFCNFFAQVGTSYAAKIKESNKNYQYYLTKGFTQKPNSLFLYRTDEIEIKRIISSIKGKQAKVMMDFLQFILEI